MGNGQLTTYGPATHVKVGSGGQHRVIDAPVLEEGVTKEEVALNGLKAHQGMVRSLNALLTFVRKQATAKNDMGVLCAADGTSNPIVSIGGSEIRSDEVVELEKIVQRYITALHTGAPLTLTGLNAPSS